MKILFPLLVFTAFSTIPFTLNAQTSTTGANKAAKKNFYIDVHHLGGKVKSEDVAAAHVKDLAVEKKHGVDILKYWVNEEEGIVYCLASSSDTQSIRKTHAEAHGLLPDTYYKVTAETAAVIKKKKRIFLDTHNLGAGKASAQDVEAAHQKDMAVQKKYGVNIINYWFDEKSGVVTCLAEAKDSASLIKTHKEAHGLLPDRVVEVKQGH